MLLNASVADGKRLFQKSFTQYFGKDSKESFTSFTPTTQQVVRGAVYEVDSKENISILRIKLEFM